MIETYSQLFQDLLALKFAKFKTKGFYIDIGCGFPSYINNTYTLEKNYEWVGISLDISSQTNPNDGKSWEELRNTQMYVLEDALAVDYKELFKKFNTPAVVDFLSIDLEPPQLTLDCLYRIPFDDYRFNFIAFETDEYREGGDGRRDISRNYLDGLGYVFVGGISKQDDFYIHKSLINETFQLFEPENVISNHAYVSLLEDVNRVGANVQS